jgi:hypothetical protein
MKIFEMNAPSDLVDVQAWSEIAATFRRACVLHHDGFESEALDLLNSGLPALIGQWSRNSSLGSVQKKRRLMAMFIDEGRRVGEVTLVNKMLTARMNTQALENQATKEILIREGSLSGSIKEADDWTFHTGLPQDGSDDVVIVAI